MSRIFLIEDDAFLRELLRMDLEEEGHDIAEYSNGNQALSDLSIAPPDVLITDIVMQDGEGMGTIRFARKLFPNLRIIAISSHPDYLRFAAELGASDIIEKPFRTRELARALSLAEATSSNIKLGAPRAKLGMSRA